MTLGAPLSAESSPSPSMPSSVPKTTWTLGLPLMLAAAFRGQGGERTQSWSVELAAAWVKGSFPSGWRESQVLEKALGPKVHELTLV